MTDVPRQLFQRLRSRARMGVLVEGLALALVTFAVFACVSYAIDRNLRLEVGYRAVLLVALIAFSVRLLYRRLVVPLSVDLGDIEMALAVERADPEVKQSLISSVQFVDQLRDGTTGPESPALMQAVVDQTQRRVADFASDRAVDRGRILRFVGVAGAAIGVLALLAATTSDFGLWARRNLAMSSLEWPRDTLLAFADTETRRVPEGDDLTLSVVADGVVPEQVFLRYVFDGGESGTEPMTLTGDQAFTFTLPSLLEGATLHATGGDGLTEDLRIEIVERPRVEGLVWTLEFPDYMGLPPAEHAETTGDLSVPLGSRVAVRGRSTKPLQGAHLAIGDDRRVDLELRDDGDGFGGSFELEEAGLCTIHVLDRDRLDSARPPQVQLRLVEDKAPDVTFEPTGVGSMLLSTARIPGVLRVREDYGLRELEAHFRVAGGAEATEGTEGETWRAADVGGLDNFAPDTLAFEDTVTFDLRLLVREGTEAPEPLLEAGQFLSLRFGAVDNFGPGEAHRGESDPVVFRIVARDKLLEDLSRRQAEQRRELEQILMSERADLAELREILSPAASDERAEAAKLRILALAREQRALGRRVAGVGTAYAQILDEYLNNRLLEPGPVAELRGKIPVPLAELAAEGFPDSAASVQEFAGSGEEDVRAVAILSYESNVQRLRQVLEHMQKAENFATLLEGIKETLKLQNSAIRSTKQRRDEELGSLFGPPDDKENTRTEKRKDK